MSPPLSLDQIAMAADEARRQQQRERIRQMSADMADEIERIKAEDWQAPEGVDEPTFEEAAPADWFIREQIAKAKAAQGLAEEAKDDPQNWYSLETD